MQVKVLGPYPTGNGEDGYIVRVLDSDTGALHLLCTWIGTKSDAKNVGETIVKAYKQGLRDGEQKTLNRVVDMVQQWGGEKQ